MSMISSELLLKRLHKTIGRSIHLPISRRHEAGVPSKWEIADSKQNLQEVCSTFPASPVSKSKYSFEIENNNGRMGDGFPTSLGLLPHDFGIVCMLGSPLVEIVRQKAHGKQLRTEFEIS